MKYYVVDAFASKLFTGNPAGVCLLDGEISDLIMQKIATENNISETAFVLKKYDTYYLRWFTPEREIDLCGHATLASAFVIMNYVEKKEMSITFHTMSGILTVERDEDVYYMNFPSRKPVPKDTNYLINEALNCNIIETLQSRDLIVVTDSQKAVSELLLDVNLLRQYNDDVSFGLIVTAKGDDVDFVSRYFAPNSSIMEDPVTGSAHSALVPYWSEKLGKRNLTATQLSARGGELICQDYGDRVSIGGTAVIYLAGEIKGIDID